MLHGRTVNMRGRRSRSWTGTTDTDLIPIKRRRESSPRSAGKPAGKRIDPALERENVRREWQAKVSQARDLRAAGKDYSDAAAQARSLKAKLDSYAPPRERVAVDISTGSEVNPLKAV